MTKYTIKKEKDFVQIPNSILTNPDISLKAKGILALMLSLPVLSKNKKFEMDIYRKAIKTNIEYNVLIQKEPLHKYMIDEIVELMAETLSSKREEITIASDTHSMADVF